MLFCYMLPRQPVQPEDANSPQVAQISQARLALNRPCTRQMCDTAALKLGNSATAGDQCSTTQHQQLQDHHSTHVTLPDLAILGLELCKARMPLSLLLPLLLIGRHYCLLLRLLFVGCCCCLCLFSQCALQVAQLAVPPLPWVDRRTVQQCQASHTTNDLQQHMRGRSHHSKMVQGATRNQVSCFP